MLKKLDMSISSTVSSPSAPTLCKLRVHLRRGEPWCIHHCEDPQEMEQTNERRHPLSLSFLFISLFLLSTSDPLSIFLIFFLFLSLSLSQFFLSFSLLSCSFLSWSLSFFFSLLSLISSSSLFLPFSPPCVSGLLLCFSQKLFFAFI